MKTLAIMQPYFLPYIGYWQLLNSADEFIIYDNIQYTKKGWINRNRFLLNGKDEIFSIPLKSASDYLNIIEREISPSYNRTKLIAQLENSYRRAPHFKENFSIIEKIIMSELSNLFSYILNSVWTMSNYLNITTDIIVSSEIDIDHTLKSQDKVIALCKAQDADIYTNPIGGTDLYDSEAFKKNAIELNFLKTDGITYPQFENDFIPHLSILDTLMFNSRDEVIELLNRYKLAGNQAA